MNLGKISTLIAFSPIAAAAAPPKPLLPWPEGKTAPEVVRVTPAVVVAEWASAEVHVFSGGFLAK